LLIAIVSVVSIGALTPQFGVVGQLVALLVTPLVCGWVLVRAARVGPHWPVPPGPSLDAGFMRRAVAAGAVTLVSQASMQYSLFVIRGELAARGGDELNGQYQAASSMGSVYLSVLLGSLGSYFYPRFARARTAADLQVEVDRAAKFVSTLAIPVVMVALVLSDLVVPLLYSSKFETATSILRWQLAGDTAKCLSWVFAGPLLYQSKLRAYVVTEVIAAALLGSLSVLLLRVSGVVGLGQAYFLTYFVYLAVSVVALFVVCGVAPRLKILLVVVVATALNALIAAVFEGQLLLRVLVVVGAVCWVLLSAELRAGLRAHVERRFGAWLR
jgi:PST family polysaccharide transporter